MRIGIIDVDGHNFPNIPLMKLSAYHKSSGDQILWYDPIEGMMQKFDVVYMSKVFSFTDDYKSPIYSDRVVKGGSGYCIKTENGIEHYDSKGDCFLPPEIEHIYPDYSIYGEMTNDTAYGFLTRGCPRGCAFCHVAAKEGRKSIKVADLSEFWRGQRNIVLCDPNILAYPQHTELLQQLIDSKARIDFNQGLDIRLLTDHDIDMFSRIRLKSVHFAFDRWEDKDIIEPRLREFVRKTGLSRSGGKVMVYILCNFDTTLEQDLYRIQLCRELNISPYPMIYNKKNSDRIYRKLQRWCSNYIFWKVPSFEQYLEYERR